MASCMELPKPSDAQIKMLKQKNSLLNTLENKGTQIAVVGDTSTGKSTTINFLLGFPVNFEASGIGTRRPCVICQEYDPKAEKMHFKVAFTKGGQHHSRHYSDVAGVAAEVKEANNPANEQYFDCIQEQRRKDGSLLHEDQVFDEEPIYVTMCHKSFVYGLRLIDLPGLTSSCPAPMEIARKYIQPGNVVVLVIGTDNPANAQFPMLAAKMSACAKVIFMQNFAKSIIERVADNLDLIRQKFRDQKANELAASLKLYCTDYGFPKLQKYVDRGLWKEGEGQEDWIEMSTQVSDLAEVREAMWSHATKLANNLTEQYTGTITGSISAGIQTPLTDLIEFQLGNLEVELEQLKDMVRADIAAKEKSVGALKKEVKLLSDPPQWAGLLARAAKVVSEFLDTTIEVRTANYAKIDAERTFNEKKISEFQGMSVADEISAGGKYETWSGSESVDKSIIAALEKCAGFRAQDKLLCLRSWVRLLDEFTAVLAFNPMQMIKEQNRENRMDLKDLGMTGQADTSEAVLRLVCEANSKKEPIRGQLIRFRDRLWTLVERDINYAMQVFACDETGEIREFLRIVGVLPEEEKAAGQALVNDIREVILACAKHNIESCINGCKVFDPDGNIEKTRDGKDEVELGTGLIVRSDENAIRPAGALHWLIPFKSHYLNGQIPWRNLKWAKEPQEGICPPTGEVNDIAEEEHPAEDDPQFMEALKQEIADNVKPGEPPTMNYTNAVNLRIYKLSTEMYNVELTPNKSTLRDYELEALKLLKAMQAEVASFFAAAWLPLLQNLMDVQKIKNFVINSHIKPELRKHGVLDTTNVIDGYDYMLDLLAGRPGRDNVNVIGYFYAPSYDQDWMQQTTQEELRDLETKMKDDQFQKFFAGREKPWNGDLETSAYMDLLEAKAQASNMGSFPCNHDSSKACRASWQRICEEFLFLVLQLSVRSITELELNLAVASSGSSLTASPQEIVGKLVIHRLRELGREAGTNFKDRLISVYERDITNGLKEAASVVSMTDKCPAFGEHKDGSKWLLDTMLEYASISIDRTLSGLQDSFDQLVPFDWSSLNGRLPLNRGLKGLRLKDWKKVENEAQAVDTTDEEIKEMWKAPIRSFWKTPTGDPILDGKMNIGMEADKGDATKAAIQNGGMRITCMQTVQDEAYQNLILDGLKVITRQMDQPEYKKWPADWDRKIAAPLFQTSALVIWKAMHCAAIDYCRPRLKKMLAQIYQVDSIRTMLTSAPFQSGKLDFRTMYKDTIQSKRDHLSDQEAKLERLRGVMDCLMSGKEMNAEGEVPVGFQLEAVQKELEEEKEKAKKRATAYQEDMEKAQKEAEEAQKLAEKKMKQGRILRKILHAGMGAAATNAAEQAKIAEVAKKYFAMDSLLSKYKLEINEICIDRTAMKKDKVWFLGYWFKEEGWWGKDVKNLKVPSSRDIVPYQRLFETNEVDPTGGGHGYARLTSRDVSTELTTDMLFPLATFKIPPLFPWHEHILAIECWKSPPRGMFKKGTDTKLCTIMIPLAHALKGKEEFTNDLPGFEFDDKLPFEVKSKSSGSDNCESLTFKFEKDGMALPRQQEMAAKADADLGSRAEISVTITQTFDEQDQPLLLLTEDDPAFSPPPRA